MSATDGASGQEPGAVPVDAGRPAEGDAASQSSSVAAQPTHVEAEARAQEIHAEVARTEARRAEEQVARADESVEEAERERDAAHEAEERARRHAAEVRSDADDAAQRVTASGDRGTVIRRSGSPGGGDPIVFGPFTAERPELLVAAAFVGGFVLAKIIRGMAS